MASDMVIDLQSLLGNVVTAKAGENVQDLLSTYRQTKNQIIRDRIIALTGVDPEGASDDEVKVGRQGQVEKKQIETLATEQRGQINQFADEFSGKAKSYREQLAERLSSLNQQTFERANPYILEDLNARGLVGSETARSQAQAEALKELELSREKQLTAFDTDSFNTEQNIRGGGMETYISGHQTALEAAINSRRAGLERSFQLADMAAAQAAADAQARRARRSGTINALISGGATVLGAGLGSMFGAPTIGAAAGSALGQQFQRPTYDSPVLNAAMSRRSIYQPGSTLGPLNVRSF